jgi:hypothetical protein
MRPLYKVDPQTGCWLWQKGMSDNGYGHIRLDRRIWTAHRLVYALRHNEIIERGIDICHTCDNRQCINPAHLFKGTRTDNVRDCCLKGRFKCKLSPEQVLDIRTRVANGERRYKLAAEYGVSGTLIGQICLGKAWKHHSPPKRIEVV